MALLAATVGTMAALTADLALGGDDEEQADPNARPRVIPQVNRFYVYLTESGAYEWGFRPNGDVPQNAIGTYAHLLEAKRAKDEANAIRRVHLEAARRGQEARP